MRRFILRSALFLGIVALVFGSICGVELGYELHAYAREVRAPVGASILACNDSQLEMGVDPAVEPEFFNFSAPGRTMDQAYLAMLDVFAANPGRFRTVMVDISPSAAIDAFDQPISGMGYAAQYYLLHWLHPQENRRDMTGQLAVFRDNMVGRRWRLLSRALRGKARFTSSIYGGFKPVPEALAKLAPADFAGQWKARALTFNGGVIVTAAAPIYREIDAVLELARANGAAVVLVTTPWHPALLKACDPARLAAFERATAEYAERCGCPYINLLREEYPDECWYDAQHLNERGAERFTPRLRAALKAAGF